MIGGHTTRPIPGGPQAPEYFPSPHPLLPIRESLNPVGGDFTQKPSKTRSILSEGFGKLGGKLGCVCPLSGQWETP